MASDGTLLQHRRGPSHKRSRDDADPEALAAKQQDSQLLLDFFVAVQERCANRSPRADAAAPPAEAEAETKDRSDSVATRALTPTPLETTRARTPTPFDASGDAGDDRPTPSAMRC